MKNYIKITLCVLVLGVITYLGMTYPKYVKYGSVGSVSPAGTTNQAPRAAQTVLGPGVYDATNNQYVYGCVTNPDANDRVIQTIDIAATGLSSVSTSTSLLQLTAATTSVTTTLGSNTNYIYNSSFATTTPVNYVSSTTPGLTGTNANRIWLAGSNICFAGNASTSASTYLTIKIPFIPE